MKLKRFLSVSAVIIASALLLSSCATTPVNHETTDTKATETQETTTVTEEKIITIYVDNKAAPGGNGSETAPFREISEAQYKIREIKSDDNFSADGLNVLISPKKTQAQQIAPLPTFPKQAKLFSPAVLFYLTKTLSPFQRKKRQDLLKTLQKKT